MGNKQDIQTHIYKKKERKYKTFKYMKRSVIILVTKEMQIKSTVRYYFSTSLATKCVDKVVRKQALLFFAGGNTRRNI